MKLYSLIEYHQKLEKAEVEVIFIPGIPQIHFLGLPDKLIKESFLRIKSAFKSCGYKFPITQQIIVNVKPHYLKKSSKGLELAVALAILKLTQQLKVDIDFEKSIIYGELNLSGGVAEPIDLKKYKLESDTLKMITGLSVEQTEQGFLRLESIQAKEFICDQDRRDDIKVRPLHGEQFFYSYDEAEILFLMAITRGHTLLAGSTGVGKSTLIKNFKSFSKSSKTDEVTDWCEFVMPHHSVTPAAFLGGGQNLYQGELERVKDGVLVLDEFLEFHQQVIESLRGPMTGDVLRLSRGGVYREYACDFQVVATTNLCPCGYKKPKGDYQSCRYSVKKCNGYLDKLSGPILDRFELAFVMTNQRIDRSVFGLKILERIQAYNQKQPLIDNGDATLDYDTEVFEDLYKDSGSRRRSAVLRVAQVYAIERESSKIEISDLVKAEKWTLKPFKTLQNGLS